MDYAGDNDTWKSVTKYIVLIYRVSIDWRSKSQKTVTLSIIEAEYSVIMDAC